MDDRANYYAIIPAHVRYADISPSAKLLYGEITALCNKEGFCWSSNKYFAELYKVSDRSIQNWLQELAEKEFILIEFNDDTTHSGRKVFLAQTPTKKISGAHEKNFGHNNTINNIPISKPFRTNFKNKKPKKNHLQQAKEIAQMFSDQNGGSFNNGLHLNDVATLIANHGIDRVREVALFGLSLPKDKFVVEIRKPIDLADHWPKLEELMKHPPKKESRYGIKY